MDMRTAVTAPTASSFCFPSETDRLAKTEIDRRVSWPGAVFGRDLSEGSLCQREVAARGTDRILARARKPWPVIEDGIAVVILTGGQIVRLPRVDDDEWAQ